VFHLVTLVYGLVVRPRSRTPRGARAFGSG